MTRHRRHVRPLRTRVLGGSRAAVSVGLAVVLLGGGGAFAAHRYDVSAAKRLMPGVTIAGVDVGEMSRAKAAQAVREVTDEELDREIAITVEDRAWHVTPGELGTKAKVAAALDVALGVNEEFSWPARVFRRLFDRSVGRSFDVEYRYNQKQIRRFVETVAGEVNVSATNAEVDVVDGELVLRKPKVGQALNVGQAQEALSEALTGSIPTVRFGVRPVKPDVSVEDLGYTIVIRLSDLQLYLYEGLDLVKTYPVAAGQPAYPTPQGEWTIVNKAENPTWVNPAPDGWGASLPAVIPGGAGNPLGTRALYLDAPGIRIHGTYDSGSIGSYASHGCVRMHISDVEELYGIVPVGTPVHIVL
jgi:lipoprotein-anchoring transpeptidase ErfK/SrfK